MFDNVGNKIKIVAKVYLTVMIILSVFAFIVFMVMAINANEVSIMLAALLLPPIIFVSGMVGSWFIYAFGDITTHICRQKEPEEEFKNISFNSFE